jgi:ABC-type sulfate transport system substrate-binding protein
MKFSPGVVGAFLAGATALMLGAAHADVALTVDEVFGGWAKAQQTHFADGGVFDQIVVNR